MAGVVQEAGGVRFTDEPVHRSQHVCTGGVELTLTVVSKRDHAPLVGGIALGDEEAGHVPHIIVAALESILGTGIVDTNQ